MSPCPSCTNPTTADSRFCSSCGLDLRSDEAITRTSVGSRADRGGAPPTPHSLGGAISRVGVGRLSTSDTGTDARFLPGVMIAGRYRIIGLLGKGGMGEVYRADDLTLGQPVALKFLPIELTDDPGRLQRFLNEVRIARQVSHSNVCRVYDIGEFQGQHFISMEYVDGEDLADLLRRVGRFSQDKSVQIARQICAGLAAAHARGIVHRDLKPANVMIDGEGHVRITDFGLAGIADAIVGAEIRVGTPTYMSPEQITGKEVTLKSDIYSLGLLLYELFTGKPAFRATTMAELTRQHAETLPSSPSTLVPNFDPTVERAILRCLEKDPAQRPASALAVAAALPGADALAAALEAGETPSPEMVADSGEAGGLSPRTGVACLLLLLVGVATLVGLSSRSTFPSYFTDSKPPLALRVEVQNLLREIGYNEPPVDTIFGLAVSGDYLRHVRANDLSPSRWDDLTDVRPSPLYFWYRQSPQPMTALRQSGSASFSNPPLAMVGMVRVRTDTGGRLIEFAAVAPEKATLSDTPVEPDWAPLIRAAGLNSNTLTPATPEWNPLLDCDVRRAWEGTYEGRPDVPIRVEAGGFAGRPVYFTIVAPWTTPTREVQPDAQSAANRANGIVTVVVISVIVIAASLVARRNLKAGRGDRRSAFRMGAYVFCLVLGSWLLQAHHVASIDELGMLVDALQAALFVGALTFVFYLAVEPYVRRTWPQALVSWSRLLAGRIRDPQVGRDLLLGSLAGVAVAVAITLTGLLPMWLGLPATTPSTGPVALLDSPTTVFAQMLALQTSAMLAPIGFFLLIFVLRLLTRFATRKAWPAVAIAFGIMTVIQATQQAQLTPLGWLLAAAIWGILVGVILRLGLLAAAFAFVYANLLLSLPITTDAAAWWSGRAWMGLLVLTALAGYGFYLSLAGRPIFKARLLDEV